MIACVLALSLALAPPSTHESEARKLETELIAPCCWSQQVSVHASPAADRVRADIRARLEAGQTHQQILDAYVSEYGQAILAEPPARGSNLALYVAPPIALAASAALLVALVRRFARKAGDEPSPATLEGPADPRLADELDEELERLD
jgi:cytochrome c-type biogenesis protein CcmH